MQRQRRGCDLVYMSQGNVYPKTFTETSLYFLLYLFMLMNHNLFVFLSAASGWVTHEFLALSSVLIPMVDSLKLKYDNSMSMMMIFTHVSVSVSAKSGSFFPYQRNCPMKLHQRHVLLAHSCWDGLYYQAVKSQQRC